MPKKGRETTNRPLWTCPRCHRQFKNRNQQHSCGQFSVEQLLLGKPPEVVEIFDRLAQLIQSCGQVVVAPTQSRVLFKVRTVFATVALSKKWLDLVFVLGRRLENKRIRKAQQEYPGIVHFMRVETMADLDETLAKWLQEAYEHRKRKDEGGPGQLET
jgi:hypothetical protein